MVLFVLWNKFDQCGVDSIVVADWIYNMDDGRVPANQSASILSGLAVYYMAGVCVVSEQCGCILELNKNIRSPKLATWLYF